ncbi:hypothetical protein BRADI_1g67081v3 [Brachypodium distachyon]|uniref:Uncharacterized protein n=1 Tax=Brachypodium distachyon TaxID=15368 RepID=A0A0Q3HHZ3_BRADI|nr:hypothetical protein BRADI_1g67081v3 [Brachypodium distachyon]
MPNHRLYLAYGSCSLCLSNRPVAFKALRNKILNSTLLRILPIPNLLPPRLMSSLQFPSPFRLDPLSLPLRW